MIDNKDIKKKKYTSGAKFKWVSLILLSRIGDLIDIQINSDKKNTQILKTSTCICTFTFLLLKLFFTNLITNIEFVVLVMFIKY